MNSLYWKCNVILLLLLVSTTSYGQSNPPEWFTYPKEGEYVGVSVNLEGGYTMQDSHIQSAVMSAMLSYFLQHEENKVAFSNVFKGYTYGESSSSNSSSHLFSDFVMGYELVRLEKDKEERVWVSIKPSTEKEALSYGILSFSVENLYETNNKNGNETAYGRTRMSCTYRTLNDSIALYMELALQINPEQEDNGAQVSSPARDTFIYRIDSNRSIGNKYKDTPAVNISAQKEQQAEWMTRQALSKGFKGKSPHVASQRDKGASYLLSLLDAMIQRQELYVINPDTHKAERKKASKTYATFFSGDECFIFNDIVE